MFIAVPPGNEYGICVPLFMGVVSVVVIVVFGIVRKSDSKKFYQKCQLLKLNRSPGNKYFCIGSWKEAQVAIYQHYSRGGNSLIIYMELGGLPETVIQNIGYYMQGLVSDTGIGGFTRNKALDRAVSRSWNGLYLQSRLRFRAEADEMWQMLERMYFARTELRKRVYEVR